MPAALPILEIVLPAHFVEMRRCRNGSRALRLRGAQGSDPFFGVRLEVGSERNGSRSHEPPKSSEINTGGHQDQPGQSAVRAQGSDPFFGVRLEVSSERNGSRSHEPPKSSEINTGGHQDQPSTPRRMACPAPAARIVLQDRANPCEALKSAIPSAGACGRTQGRVMGRKGGCWRWVRQEGSPGP